MTCTEEYKEHIEYTFHAFCKIVIRNASYTALRTWSRKHKREISLDYITDEKHYPLGTTDEYFKAPEPDEEYIVHLCGDTVILSNGLLVQAERRADTTRHTKPTEETGTGAIKRPELIPNKNRRTHHDIHKK